MTIRYVLAVVGNTGVGARRAANGGDKELRLHLRGSSSFLLFWLPWGLGRLFLRGSLVTSWR